MFKVCASFWQIQICRDDRLLFREWMIWCHALQEKILWGGRDRRDPSLSLILLIIIFWALVDSRPGYDQGPRMWSHKALKVHNPGHINLRLVVCRPKERTRTTEWGRFTRPNLQMEEDCSQIPHTLLSYSNQSNQFHCPRPCESNQGPPKYFLKVFLKYLKGNASRLPSQPQQGAHPSVGNKPSETRLSLSPGCWLLTMMTGRTWVLPGHWDINLLLSLRQLDGLLDKVTECTECTECTDRAYRKPIITE